MFNLFKNVIRGGLTQCSKRHTKANNKYMKDFDSSKPSSYLLYADANNLNGWAMQQYLPCRLDKTLFDAPTINNFKVNQQTGYVLVVDLDYPENLHDNHNDLEVQSIQNL